MWNFASNINEMLCTDVSVGILMDDIKFSCWDLGFFGRLTTFVWLHFNTVNFENVFIRMFASMSTVDNMLCDTDSHCEQAVASILY